MWPQPVVTGPRRVFFALNPLLSPIFSLMTSPPEESRRLMVVWFSPDTPNGRTSSADLSRLVGVLSTSRILSESLISVCRRIMLSWTKAKVPYSLESLVSSWHKIHVPLGYFHSFFSGVAPVSDSRSLKSSSPQSMLPWVFKNCCCCCWNCAMTLACLSSACFFLTSLS